MVKVCCGGGCWVIIMLRLLVCVVCLFINGYILVSNCCLWVRNLVNVLNGLSSVVWIGFNLMKMVFLMGFSGWCVILMIFIDVIWCCGV